MTADRFFGYGSLVNLHTHQYAAPQPATLTGWCRVWRGTNRRKLAYLSIEPAPDMHILGMTAIVPGGDWSALDQREAAYSKIDVSDQIDPAQTTYVYQVQPTALDTTGQHPILLSYLDVVVQGYYRAFGTAGVQHFFETTKGWDTPIQNDRANPIYPRAQTLSAAERSMVDHGLAQRHIPA